MPAFASDETLLDSARSVLSQTVADLELIVVDDAGDPPAAETLAGVRDPRLRVLRHERNQGTSAARSTGLHAARGPLVSQLDADDEWEPDYLESVLPLFEDPRVGLAYTNCHIAGHPSGLDDYIGDPSPHPIDTFPRLAEANPVPSPTATMRTSAVRAVGGWATWMRMASDYQLYLKLAAAGWRFAYLHRRLARYRWPSETRGKSRDHRALELDELRMWAAFAARHPRTPGPKRRVRVGLRRELARLSAGRSRGR
jgi:cellulose synthase/poly-beta-1,6-N-acetylglucosamine synthase-like glycosyltransferase